MPTTSVPKDKSQSPASPLPNELSANVAYRKQIVGNSRPALHATALSHPESKPATKDWSENMKENEI